MIYGVKFQKTVKLYVKVREKVYDILHFYLVYYTFLSKYRAALFFKEKCLLYIQIISVGYF